MVKLAVKIGKLKLKNPVMVASGTSGEEYGKLIDMNALGAYVAKTITLKARAGNPPPRIVETPSGMLNAIGLENRGVEDFIKHKAPFLNRLKIPVIASIAGDDEGEYRELAKRLNKLRCIDGIEVNLSCPNVKHGMREGLIAQDEKATHDVIRAVRKATSRTIIAKLSPNVTDITRIGRAAESAGADALLVANTFLGMAVDADTARPFLGNVTGGLSGPAIKPLVLRMVWQLCRRSGIPIIASGGVMDYKDAVEFMLCGACAVQIGTANFVDPEAPVKIISGIRKYLAARNMSDVNDLVGRIKA